MEIAVTLIGTYAICTTIFFLLLIQDKNLRIKYLKQDAEKAKKVQWRVEQIPEEWGNRDEETGEIKNIRPGMAVYCLKGSKKLPVGWVEHKAEDFMQQLGQLWLKGEERRSDLQALEEEGPEAPITLERTNG